jgi:hypothetical protein
MCNVHDTTFPLFSRNGFLSSCATTASLSFLAGIISEQLRWDCSHLAHHRLISNCNLVLGLPYFDYQLKPKGDPRKLKRQRILRPVTDFSQIISDITILVLGCLAEVLAYINPAFRTPLESISFLYSTMSAQSPCSALNNAIRAKGCHFPPKPGVVIDIITMFPRVYLSPDRSECRNR